MVEPVVEPVASDIGTGPDHGVTPLAGRVQILVHRRGRDGGPTVTTSGTWWGRHQVVWIDSSHGVVIGDGNLQHNTTELRVTDAQVRLGDATCGPATMRMFTALAAKPGSGRRQTALRRALLADNRSRSRAVDRPSTTHSEAKTVTATDAEVVVTRCRGVLLGNHNHQVNGYAYRWHSPEFHFAELVETEPALLDRLARALARPDDDRRMSALVKSIREAVLVAAPARYLDSPDGAATGFDLTAGVMVGGAGNRQENTSKTDVHRLDTESFIAFVCTEALERIDARKIDILAQSHERRVHAFRALNFDGGPDMPDRCAKLGNRLLTDLAELAAVHQDRLARLRPADPTYADRRARIEADLRRLDTRRAMRVGEVAAARIAAEDAQDGRVIADLCADIIRRIDSLPGMLVAGHPVAHDGRRLTILAAISADLDQCFALHRTRVDRLSGLEPDVRLGWFGSTAATRIRELTQHLDALHACRDLAAGDAVPSSPTQTTHPGNPFDRVAAVFTDLRTRPASPDTGPADVAAASAEPASVVTLSPLAPRRANRIDLSRLVAGGGMFGGAVQDPLPGPGDVLRPPSASSPLSPEDDPSVVKQPHLRSLNSPYRIPGP
ncbi:hypothetical protein MXD59_13645 [Frankia sp. Ag45/Mut15]|uniref:FHA domain-containing protein n=1 Tax=Frankia umida TaxID=573489 RepID=A0ABT0JZ43_9ACTN|nr:hypothetical protein [Frankia umida]MCK9876810.1 hypothetical protein [Frankia umida]